MLLRRVAAGPCSVLCTGVVSNTAISTWSFKPLESLINASLVRSPPSSSDNWSRSEVCRCLIPVDSFQFPFTYLSLREGRWSGAISLAEKRGA